MITTTFIKSTSEVLDYKAEWTEWLGVDTISTSVWAATTGITVDSESETATAATIWLSGGTDGDVYTVTNTIVTAAARTAARSFFISVEIR